MSCPLFEPDVYKVNVNSSKSTTLIIQYEYVELTNAKSENMILKISLFWCGVYLLVYGVACVIEGNMFMSQNTPFKCYIKQNNVFICTVE